MTEYLVGIDPGWKNLGITLVEKTETGLHLVKSEVINPSSFKGGEYECSCNIKENYFNQLINPTHLTIERFVPFNGQATHEAEFINILIGAIIASTSKEGLKISRVRSVEWKTSLVKSLVKKKGFDNPSATLDKKFSLAAAQACLDSKIERKITDHEADAICLASFPIISGT